MATQEIHYKNMAQVVELLSMDLVIIQEPKNLRSMAASQAYLAPLVWMTNFHHHQQVGARNWVSLITIMVPDIILAGPLF